MKLVHAADLHIDSPLRGLERYEGAPVDRMRGATRRALESLVDMCVSEEVGLLLLAGDLFDGEWRDYATGLFFAAQMTRLREADVQVVWIRGNHDAASHIRKHLQLSDNVRELSPHKPETLELERLGIAVHGQGFAKRAVTHDLAAAYPEPIAGVFNIGLLHTSASGRPGHEPYAPCSVELLRAKGYDYWALGHVHRREVLSEDPPIVFCGNLQGRHVGETGPKGATLIELVDGRVADIEHRAVDAVRWARIEVDAGEARSPWDAMDRLLERLEAEVERADGRALAARMEIVGTSAAHAALVSDLEHWENQIRASAADVGDVWIEKIRVRTLERLELGELAARDDAIGHVVRALEEPEPDPEILEVIGRDAALLARKLPKEVRGSGPEGALSLDEPRSISAALADAKELLLSRILAGEAER